MTKSSLFDQNRFRDGGNKTIYNTCVPPQILDILKYLKKPLKKRNNVFYVVFQPMPMLAFLLAFSCC